MVELLAFPHRGIGPFVLGALRGSIILIVGNPDYVETTTSGNSVAEEEWYYNKLGVTLKFSEEEDWKLSSITALGSQTILNGVRFIGTHEINFDTLCSFAGIDDLRPDGDYGEYGSCYWSESLGLMLWVEAGYVVKIHLFPKYDATGNQPIWPVINEFPT
jgi:hypothetical protein